MQQVVAPDGSLVADPPIDLDHTRRLYAAMVGARVYDDKCSALQRQGRLATYSGFRGQEAAQIGSADALEHDDWMVASYRDAAAMWHHGYPWLQLILGRTGDERGGSPPEDVPVLPPSITVGAHMLHAVGLAWAMKMQGSSRAAITYFGDGATSEGDFHEAMNFAAVYDTPAVFLCQNNGYAISLPTDHQTRSETIATKAVAYGMPGVVVDGNDVIAVYQATRDALDRGRRGEGPTLIEAVTYRMGPHTTADDPTRYRDGDEAEEWRERDPLLRIERYLAANDAWEEAWALEVKSAAEQGIADAVAAAEDLPAMGADGVFGSMFESATRQLNAQRLEAEQG